MAITYPLALASFWDALSIAAQPFDLANYEANALTNGGLITTVRAKPRWKASVSLIDAQTASTVDVEAIVGALNGSVGSFQAYDLTRPYPKQDPTGSIIGSNTVQVSSKPSSNTVILKGLTAGYVLSVGDYIAIPSRMYLGQVLEASTANGSGVSPAAFTVRPYFPTAVAADDVVIVKKPYGFFKILPGSMRGFGKAPGRSSGASFEMLQVLQ